MVNPQTVDSEEWWNRWWNEFALSIDLVQKIARYITEMQELWFGVTDQQALALLTSSVFGNHIDEALHMWNCDKTGLSYVTNPAKLWLLQGKCMSIRRIMQKEVLDCVCADETWIPPCIIFKGVRWNGEHKRFPAKFNNKLSQKGWINCGSFLEWFQFPFNPKCPFTPSTYEAFASDSWFWRVSSS